MITASLYIGEGRMSKKTLPLILLLVLLFSLWSQSVSAPKVVIPAQTTLVMETIDHPASVDPAWAIDTASRALIFNVYDPLVFFDRTEVGEFIKVLATDYLIDQPPHPDAPEGTNQTWYFLIREGVKFQDGSTLTTADVEYSFERAMVQDRSGGPVWMLNLPLFGEGWPDKTAWPEAPGNPIDTAVESNSTWVWFNLAMPYPPFMQILCGSWASLLSKAWCSTIPNEWDGDWSDWKAYEDPDNSPLDAAGNVMCGTGPYMLDYLRTWGDWRIVAFNKDIVWPTGYDPAGPNPTHSYEYWQGWPAAHCSRYLEDVKNLVTYLWGPRRTSFLAGTADEVYVPTAYLPQMELNWPTTWDPDAMMRLDAGGDPEYYATGIECLPGIPTLTIDAAMFFTFDVNPASPYVGTGSFPNGIPLDFFSDARIRKAFAYCFDYDEFLEDIYWGEAEQPPSCVIRGLLYHNPANPKYDFNLTKARELFMNASADPTSPAYQVWDLGFTMTITYNNGHIPRQTAATMMKIGVENLFALGPDGIADTGDEAPGTAVISMLGLTGPAFESDLRARFMPLFMTGWIADYPDPHNFVVPYMHTYGDFTRFQHYSNSTVDALIEQGITTPDGPARQAIYETLQLMYFQDCPSVCLAQALKRHWERDWVQGWYHNPLYPGQKYFYHLWKGLNGDINGDNKVNILDFGEISGHWYPGPPVGPLGYDPIADLWPKLQCVLSEEPYDAIPKIWDEETQTWIPDPSIRTVDIFDAALVSAHWLEYDP